MSSAGSSQPVLMELSAPPIYMNSPHHEVGLCSGGLGDTSSCLDNHRVEEVGNFINLLPPPPLTGNLLSHEPQLFNHDGHSEDYITNIIDPINFQVQSSDHQQQAHITTHPPSASNLGSRPSVFFDRQYEDNCGESEITDLDLATSGSIVIKSCKSPTAATVIVNGTTNAAGPQIGNAIVEYSIPGTGEQQPSYSTIHTISSNNTTVTTIPKPSIIGVVDVAKTDEFLSHTPPISADETAAFGKAGSAVDTVVVVSGASKVSKHSRSRVKPGRPPRAARGMVHHKCRSCEKTFISHKGLTQHEVIHTDKKPFECKICGKAFKFKSNLFEHKSIHADGNRYKCQLCGKTCRLKGNLKKHLRTHEKNGELKNFDLACREIINCNQNANESKESTIDEEGEEEEDHEVGEGDSEPNLDSKNGDRLLKDDPVSCKSTPETAYRVIVCHSTQNTKRSDGQISAFADDPDDAYVPQSAGDAAPPDSILIGNISSPTAQAYIVETPVIHLPTKDFVKVEVSQGQLDHKAKTAGDPALASSSPGKDKPPGTAKRKKKAKDATVAENTEKKPPKTPSSTPRKPRRKKTEIPPNSSSLTDSEAGMMGPILQMVGTFAPKMATPLLNFQNNHNNYHPCNSPGPLFHGPQVLPPPHDNTTSAKSNPTSSIINYSSSGISGRPMNSLSCSSDATTLSLQNMVELHCQSESVIYDHQPTQSIVICQSLPSESQVPIPDGGYSTGVPTASFGTSLIGQNSNFTSCSGLTTLPIYSYSNSINQKFAAHDLLHSTTLAGMYPSEQPLHQQFVGCRLSPGVLPSAVCCYNNSSFNAESGGGMVYAQPAMTYMQSLPPFVHPHSVGYSTFSNVLSNSWNDSPASNSKCADSNLNPPPSSVALSSAAVYANSVHLEPFLPPPLGGLTSLAAPSRRDPVNKVSPAPTFVSDSQSPSALSHPMIVSYGEKAKDTANSPITTRVHASGAKDGRNLEHSFPRGSGEHAAVSTSHFPNSTNTAFLNHDVVNSAGRNRTALSEVAHRDEDKKNTAQRSMAKSDSPHSAISVSNHRPPALPPPGTSGIAFGAHRQNSVLSHPRAGDPDVAASNYLHNHCQSAGAQTSNNRHQTVETIDNSKLECGDNVVENPTDQSFDPTKTTAVSSHRRNDDIKIVNDDSYVGPTSLKSLAVPNAVSSQSSTVSRTINLPSPVVGAGKAPPKCLPPSPDIASCGGAAGKMPEPFVPIPPSVVVVERKLKSSCDLTKLFEDFRDLRYYQLQKPFVHVRKTNRRNGEKATERSFPPSSSPYSCWICELTFGSRREARLHFLLSSSHSTDTVCLRCLRPFSDRTQREAHDRGVHEQVARMVHMERVKWKVDPENVVVPVILEKMCIN